jgi:hypothetical protein
VFVGILTPPRHLIPHLVYLGSVFVGILTPPRRLIPPLVIVGNPWSVPLLLPSVGHNAYIFTRGMSRLRYAIGRFTMSYCTRSTNEKAPYFYYSVLLKKHGI